MADYVKLPELARRLAVSEKTARRMVRAGKLPAVFIGGAYRVSEVDLAKYLEDAKVRTADAETPALDLVAMFEEPDGEERRRVLTTATDEERATYLRELEAFAERTEALIAGDEQAAEQHQGQRILARRLRALLAEAEATATLSEPVDATVAAQAREMLHAS